MNNQERLYNVFVSLFAVPAAEVTDDLSQDNVQMWDSFGMVNLVAELENEFDIRFDLLEISDFRTVGLVKTILIEKGIKFD